MSLAVKLKSTRKGLINIKNKDQNVFYVLMLDILILQKNIQKELKKTDKKIAEKLDYDGIQFPVQEKDFNKIEVKNDKCINVFGYEMCQFFQFIFR